MEISLRLDTLGMVELRYLRGRERYREWPQFQLLAASRQARVLAYFTHDVAEQLHQQILMVEAAVGLDVEDAEDEDDDDDDDEKLPGDENENENEEKEVTTERDTTAFSPAFAQALKQLNEFARQRLPDGGVTGSQVSGELPSELDPENEEDALEQLQDAFVQMMEVVRELAEEMSTDALKLTSRFKCARTNIEFIPRADSPDDDDDDDDDHVLEMATEEGILDIEVELVMVLQLFEEGRARADDLPAVELQLDVDDFEHLHETLDIALERERRSRRRR